MIGLLVCSGFVPVANLFRREIIVIENVLITVFFGIFHLFFSGKIGSTQRNTYKVYFVFCQLYLILGRKKNLLLCVVGFFVCSLNSQRID